MNKLELQKTLELLQAVGSQNEKNPADLSNKVIVEKDKLINNFNNSFITVVEQEFGFEGIFDLTTFVKVVKSLNSDDIELEYNADKKEVILSALRTKIGLKELNIEKLELPIPEKPSKLKSLPEDFLKALQLCMSCCSRNEYSPLRFIVVNKDKMIASDQDKIGIYNLQIPLKRTMMIHNAFAQKILALNPVKFVDNDLLLFFARSDSIYSFCSNFKYDYPDFEKILNKKYDNEIVIPKELKEATEISVNLFASLKKEEHTMIVSLQKNRILIRSESDFGWMDKTIRTKYSGKEISFKINSVILKQVLDKTDVLKISEDNLAKIEFDNFTYILPIEKE